MENAKPKLTESMAAKTAAFILAVIVSAATLLCALAVVVCFDLDAYRVSENEVKQTVIDALATDMADEVFYAYYFRGAQEAEDMVSGTNLSFAIYDDSQGSLLCGAEKSESEAFSSETKISAASGGYDEASESYVGDPVDFTVRTFVDKDLEYSDQFALAGRAVEMVYHLRYWGYIGAALGLLMLIVLFVFMMCAAGHRTGYEGIYAGPMTKIPFDLFTAVVIGIVMLFAYLASEGTYGLDSDAERIALVSFSVFCILPVLFGWCIDFAARIKRGKWWRNTIIFIILRFVWTIIKKLFSGIGYGLSNMTLIWNTVFILLAIAVYSVIMVAEDNIELRLILLLIGGTVLGASAMYVSISLRKLQDAGRRIAGGDVDFRVDTGRMHGPFRQHGENLNSIGLGMTRAVDERMKSERLKTELITNVSHDIKTPLTSIINYTDLISKEQCDNEKITEYTAVLARQSERLKKLIEDLVEASKASTGNIEVHFAPCDVGVMLDQTAAEYEERLTASGLELVVTKPEKPVRILADGRLLWRVFDNLMSNVCKYAQPETRVYVGIDIAGGEAAITFKNVSRYPLNITADELMERFVRGDSARHTEGSGLGLSIAKSLAELQNGGLKLDIDGDLFKATVRFHTITE
jgi:signal transduction histidine kinase